MVRKHSSFCGFQELFVVDLSAAVLIGVCPVVWGLTARKQSATGDERVSIYSLDQVLIHSERGLGIKFDVSSLSP